MPLSRYLALASLLCLVGCKYSSTPNTVADEAQIRKLDADWVKAAATHSAEAWDAFYADDAVVLPPNEKTADTKDKIRASTTAFLSLPELVVTWEPTRIVVANAGDMAYAYGTYKLTMKDPSGKPIADTGKTVEVWHKQPNGEWKCVVDTWNSDMPMA